MQESEFITTYAPTLERLKKLPIDLQALLLLKKLRRSFRDHKVEPQRFHKNNALNRAASMVDPYGLANGFPQAELGQVVKHLLGAPWFNLEQHYYIVNTTGDGWYEVTDEGMERSNDEFPALVPAEKESDAKVDQFKGWERIRQLGEGGQSTVFLVRSPQRAQIWRSALDGLMPTIKDGTNPTLLVGNIRELLREDAPTELGALKVFDKARESDAAPQDRIRREISILEVGYPNLPKLLASDVDNMWLVTEYFPSGSLDKSPEHFKGDALGALKAFRPLVETVAHLHDNKIIHRDIKPANIFIGNRGELVLGDFGIAFEETSRLTVTHERVGPWDYMPQWGDLGERLERVAPSFDVYMLGKLLWCMVSGRLKLPREYHRRDEFDLIKMFPNDRHMNIVNSILDRCIVEHEAQCLMSANDLLKLVDGAFSSFNSTLSLNDKDEVELPCLICGKGKYIEENSGRKIHLEQIDNGLRRLESIDVRAFHCDFCRHYTFFSVGYPDQALKPKRQSGIPLSDELRAAYSNLYNALNLELKMNPDVAVRTALGGQRRDVADILTKNNMYKLQQDTAIFEALQKQISSTTSGLATLQTQISSTASHFKTGGSILDAITTVLSLL